ncbi:uncharacterized protein EV422DRAFT_524190 [Fimicolochytrium jonesii]|uniref:uncharacterized protein n=1 Tax=Fimicolochytrium jonesii TaxID=1396493 RepID=UPI0022FDEA10|nr:uncharacterized protein EV422DRAFT_524190 [Fimicolochytrium jonesii]KAI8822491.1 hypothetical protein EV422DRAFT_524190 [Fimicolochytrium jonesii]
MLPSTALLVIGALLVVVASEVKAQSVLLGARCNPNTDLFGCSGKNYMSCDPTSNRWITQNTCLQDCITVPAFAQNCGRNSHGIEDPATAAPAPAPTPTRHTSTSPSTSLTPETSLSQPVPSNILAPQPSTIPNKDNITTGSPLDPSNPNSNGNPITDKQPGDGSGSSSSSSSSRNIAVIVGPVAGGAVLIAAIVAASLLMHRRRYHAPKHGLGGADVANMEVGTGALYPSGPFSPNVSSVLEKRYVVAHAYDAAADDEISLRVGDHVRLNLLFNDGWAKGVNETSGKHGLLPCACIQDDAVAETKPFINQ